MIKNEIKIFFTALMFYTRIPVPSRTGYSNENLNKATRYFPLAGIIAGGIGALVFVMASILFSTNIAVLFAMGTTVLLTGAFHEDALSDFCDGFGGGYSKEKILSIMKDSRIGTYGATALIFLLLSKYVFLTEIQVSEIPLVFIAAHGFSRINPVLLIFSAAYVRHDDSSKSKPVGEKSSLSTLLIAIILGCLPLLLISPIIIPAIIGTSTCVFFYFRYYVIKKIGGYTGDVLGALQQISEVCFYITYLACSNLL